MSEGSLILCFGEVLWDIINDQKIPGGAPMNVALHLNKLGQNVRFVSRTGNDQPGSDLEKFLVSNGFNDFLFQRDPHYSTGTAEVDTTDPNNPQYIFPESAWDHIEFDSRLEEDLNHCEVVIHGSLIARNDRSYKTLLRILEDDRKYKVFDVNLRRPHYSRNLLEVLLKKANLVKMNEDELRILSGWFFHDDTEEHLLEAVSHRFKCEIIVVTKGDGGASLLYHNNYYTHPGFTVEVADTVGAGDAFLAGLLSSLLKGENPRDMLNFASAMAAFVVSKNGANPDYTIEQIHALIHP